MSNAETTERQKNEKPARLHLQFLDGMRGLAALYVATAHIVGESAAGQSRFWQFSLHWLLFARLSVAVFIVLSGYCLMIPVARNASGVIPGGFLAYIKRRSRRILPPYYLALALSLLIAAASRTGLALLHGSHQAKVNALRAVLAPGDLVTHLFLVHNLFHGYALNLDPPAWSVATEWQIYFFFPLLLLPVWRRTGITAAVAAGFVLGMLPQLLLPAAYNLNWACPWYLGLFATGMAGACITFREEENYVRLRSKHWGKIAAWSWLAVFLLMWYRDGNLYPVYGYVPDAVTGFATMALIVWCAEHLRSGHTAKPALLCLFESKPAVTLGAFSYSLYLIHQPLTLKLAPLMDKLPRPLQMPLLILVGMPAVLFISWLFYLLIEKRCQSRPEKAVRAAVLPDAAA